METSFLNSAVYRNIPNYGPQLISMRGIRLLSLSLQGIFQQLPALNSYIQMVDYAWCSFQIIAAKQCGTVKHWKNVAILQVQGMSSHNDIDPRLDPNTVHNRRKSWAVRKSENYNAYLRYLERWGEEGGGGESAQSPKFSETFVCDSRAKESCLEPHSSAIAFSVQSIYPFSRIELCAGEGLFSFQAHVWPFAKVALSRKCWKRATQGQSFFTTF